MNVEQGKQLSRRSKSPFLEMNSTMDARTKNAHGTSSDNPLVLRTEPTQDTATTWDIKPPKSERKALV